MASSLPSPLILASLNRKGGVGKTHVSWLIASACVTRNLRCLVVDLDPQANFTSSVIDESPALSVARLFDSTVEPDISPIIHKTRWPLLDVAPATPSLEQFNISDPSMWAKTDLQLSLAESIEGVKQDYDFIVFDCPPTLSLVSFAALCGAEFLMIPLEAARWGALGTQHVVGAMEQVQASHNPNLKLLGYVVSRYKGRRAYQQTYKDELYRQFDNDVFKTVIPDLAAFEKAVTDRIPITLHSPNSHAASITHRFFDEVQSRAKRLTSDGQSNRGESVSTTI